MKILKWIKIEKIWYGGIGLARMPDGKRILIRWWALPGSVVDLKITKKKKDFVEAHILEIKSYDPNLLDREAFCPHFFSSLKWPISKTETTIWCGWCKRQMMTYPNQLKLKQDIILDSFTKIQKLIPSLSILPIIWSPQEKNYRNKIEFSFWKFVTKINNENVFLSDRSLWFHKQWEFSKIIDIDNCDLISPKANQIFNYIKNLLKKSWLPVYDQKTHKWFFRHLIIREGTNTDQILVNLVVADQFLQETSYQDSRNNLLETLQKDEYIFQVVTTFVLTYNNWLADIARGPDSESKIIFGDWYIYDKLIFQKQNNSDSNSQENTVDLQFRISPFSFFQTNTLWAELLFQTASKMLGYTQWTILDLYCGTWSIGLSFLKMWIWDNLLGVEIVEEAIVDAQHNARINLGDQEVYFVATPAEKAFTTNPEITEKLSDLWLVIVDPPRDWLHKSLVSTLWQLKKEHDFKLLYISCNPITMARDIELLLEEWFSIKQLQPVDMFPQTHHIEVIGVLN